MHKRKNIGIIKYGPRLSKNTAVRKFQVGGAASVESHYEWREDPYELMLMRQEAAELGAGKSSGRKGSSSSSSATKDPKISSFAVLDGGLKGTRDALNAKYKALQQDYQDEVSKNPPAWVSSLDSQRMFQNVVTAGQEFQQLLNREQEQFNTAKADLNDNDSEALAISSRNRMMVQEAGTGKVAFIGLQDYLKDPTKYHPKKLEEFMYWKENRDVSGVTGDTSLINEFMINNAVSPEDVTKQYVIPRLGSISYIEENGYIVPSGNNKDGLKKGDPISSVEKWSKTISAALNNTVASDVPEQTQTKILDIISTIYDDIIGRTADSSRLQASLYSEVLSDLRHRAELEKLPEEQRGAYLQKQANLALVNKIYTKGGSSASTSTSTDTTSGNKGPTNPIIAAYSELDDGNQISTYTFGKDFLTGEEKNKKRVADIRVPMKNNVAGPLELALATTPEEVKKRGTDANTVKGNTFVNTYLDTSRIYLENGMELNSTLTEDGAQAFLDESVRLAKGYDMDMVFVLTDEKGNMTMREVDVLGEQKIKNRKAFLKSHNAQAQKYGDMEAIDVSAEDILPGSSNPKTQRAYALFQQWADFSADLDKYAAADLTKKDNFRLLEMAKDSDEMRKDTGDLIKSLQSKKLTPMMKVTVLVDNDGTVNLYDKAKDHSKKSGYGEGIIKGEVTEDDKSYMADLNKVDGWNIWQDWNIPGLWPFDDNVYKTNIFVPVNSLATIQGKEKGHVERTQAYKNIDNAVKMTINANNAITNPGNAKALSQFIRE